MRKVEIVMYEELVQETILHIKERYPETYAEAEKDAQELLDGLVFLSHENRLLAKDMFLKGFLVGRHGKRIS